MTVFPSGEIFSQAYQKPIIFLVLIGVISLLLERNSRPSRDTIATGLCTFFLGLLAIGTTINWLNFFPPMPELLILTSEKTTSHVIIANSGLILSSLNLYSVCKNHRSAVVSPGLLLMCVVFSTISIEQNSIAGQFLSLEGFTFTAFALARSKKLTEKRHEASCKFFLIHQLLSLFGLFGFCLVYAGSTTLGLSLQNEMNQSIMANSLLLQVGLAIIFVCLMLKSAFIGPLFWGPGMIEASPQLASGAILICLSLISISIINPWLDESMAPLPHLLPHISLGICLTGSLLASVQYNLGRQIAYLYTAQCSTFLLALSLTTPSIFIKNIELEMQWFALNLLLFFGLCYRIVRERSTSPNIDDFCRLFKRNRIVAIALSASILGLSGYATPNFFGSKILILTSLDRQGYSLLFSMIYVLTSTFATYVYLKMMCRIYGFKRALK